MESKRIVVREAWQKDGDSGATVTSAHTPLLTLWFLAWHTDTNNNNNNTPGACHLTPFIVVLFHSQDRSPTSEISNCFLCRRVYLSSTFSAVLSLPSCSPSHYLKGAIQHPTKQWLSRPTGAVEVKKWM